MEVSAILSIIGLVVLIILSALTSATETAITAVNRIKVKQKAEEGLSSAKILEKLYSHPGRFLATILFINTLVNIGSAALATSIAARYVAYPAAVATGVMTFVILVFAEISPKTFAVQKADIAFKLAKPLKIVDIVLYPVVRVLILTANLILKLFGVKSMKQGPFVTEEEIRMMVSVGEEEGVIQEQEREMIDSIFEFGDTIVKEVMVPRMDMMAVSNKDTVSKILKLILHEGFSRIPIFEKTIDNVIGIVYARDLLVRYGKGEKEVSLKKLIRPAYYVPETMKVIDLLKELQRRKIHMAIVVDEYGGTAGLVTIEDLLEEIVGEIFDEYDFEEVLIERIDDKNVRVEAKVDLDEINEILEIDLPEAEYESIGGFVVDLFGKIPSPGDKIDYNNLTFTVEKVIKHRVYKILITKKEGKEENEEDENDKRENNK
ncbi:MAG: HlyC/CorC family transporter [Actinobacteria bacterium]|nr:MAG: HlyC/CorC family transporter [Actinomycetota bacterium]